MTSKPSAAQRFRAALAAEKPLQIVGAINAYSALLARRAGFRAIYLSGAGVANASFGLPDLGVTTLDDVATDARRIARACELPLLVDADTGWGDATKTARTLIEAGAAGMHLEDQIEAKRCGHRPGKELVSSEDMQARIRSACVGRGSDEFVIMARTDAAAVEGVDAAIARALDYVKAGADMIFAEALTDLPSYKRFTEKVGVPVLANMTEFGKTPILRTDEFARAGVAMVLYPLSAFRAMSKAAQNVYETLRRDGSQQAVLGAMQTRAELYQVLNYEYYEEDLSRLFRERE